MPSSPAQSCHTPEQGQRETSHTTETQETGVKVNEVTVSQMTSWDRKRVQEGTEAGWEEEGPAGMALARHMAWGCLAAPR